MASLIQIAQDKTFAPATEVFRFLCCRPISVAFGMLLPRTPKMAGAAPYSTDALFSPVNLTVPALVTTPLSRLPQQL